VVLRKKGGRKTQKHGHYWEIKEKNKQNGDAMGPVKNLKMGPPKGNRTSGESSDKKGKKRAESHGRVRTLPPGPLKVRQDWRIKNNGEEKSGWAKPGREVGGVSEHGSQNEMQVGFGCQ